MGVISSGAFIYKILLDKGLETPFLLSNQGSKIVKFERVAKKIRSLHSEPDSHLTKNQKKITIAALRL